MSSSYNLTKANLTTTSSPQTLNHSRSKKSLKLIPNKRKSLRRFLRWIRWKLIVKRSLTWWKLKMFRLLPTRLWKSWSDVAKKSHLKDGIKKTVLPKGSLLTASLWTGANPKPHRVCFRFCRFVMEPKKHLLIRKRKPTSFLIKFIRLLLGLTSNTLTKTMESAVDTQ